MKFGQQSTLAKKIGRRYASAAFNAASEAGRIEAVQLDMALLAEVVKGSAEFRSFINAAHLPPETCIAVFRELFAKRVQPLTFGLLALLAQRRRMNILPEVVDAFESRYHQYHGITKVKITSAVALEPGQVDRICAKLKERWQRGIFAETAVDPNLIAGFQIRSGDRVLDLSIKSQLEHYRQSVINV